MSARIRMFDTTGKLVGDKVLPGIGVQTRFINGTARLAMPTASGGWTQSFVLAEALHGKHHGKGHREKNALDVNRRHVYVGADGEKSGGPLAASLVAIEGKPLAGSMNDWTRIEGGWALKHTTTTTYNANGSPAVIISVDVTNPTIASISTPRMYLGDATRAVKQAGGAFANILLPPIAAAQDPVNPNAADGSDANGGGTGTSGPTGFARWLGVIGHAIEGVAAIGTLIFLAPEITAAVIVWTAIAAVGLGVSLGYEIAGVLSEETGNEIIACQTNPKDGFTFCW